MIRDAEVALNVAASQPSAQALAYNLIGLARLNRGEIDLARTALARSIELAPELPWAHHNMGRLLYTEGNLDGAITCYRTSIAREPLLSNSHNSLGYALYKKGELNQALDCYRKAASLNSKDPWPHFNAGLALIDRGDLDQAIRSFEAARERDHNLSGTTIYLRQLNAWKELLPRLPEIAAGRALSMTPAEALDCAELCRQPFQKRFFTAVRMYQMALAGDPKLAAIRTPDGALIVRYNAACTAALAAAGKDREFTRFGIDEWGYLTDLAHRWLRADLADLVERARDPRKTAGVRDSIQMWKNDPDLLQVRDPAWLAAMPEPDRRRWQTFWAELDSLLAQVSQSIRSSP
jgi:tetratricopeptide (TPR) repeat protein